MNELVKLCSLVSMTETMPHDKNRHYLISVLSSCCYNAIIQHKYLLKLHFKNRHTKKVSLSNMRTRVLLIRAFEGLSNKALSLDY